MRIPRGILGFIVVFQTVLFVTHLFLYETWTFSSTGAAPPNPLWLRLALAVLSATFLAASLLAFRYTNPALRLFYRIAAVWLGLVSFLFFAAAASWIVFAIARIAGASVDFHRIAETLFAVALALGFYAFFNASWTRVQKIVIKLENLP